MANTPIIGAPEWASSQASPWVTVNQAMRMIEAMARRGIIQDRDLMAPPGSCADGDCYLVDSTATGDWATHDGEMAIAVGANAASGWYFVDVEKEGTQLYVTDEDIEIRWTGAAWEEVNPEVVQTFTMTVAASDESTALTAGSAKITFEWPVDINLTAVYAFITTAAASSAPVEVDVDDDGDSIFSTRPTIDTGERTSRTAAIPAVLDASPRLIEAGSVVTIDVIEPGDGAAGLKLTFIGTYVE